MSRIRVGVIGAGLSGLTCANLLSKDSKFHVTVFEKSRGHGRVSGRRFPFPKRHPQEPLTAEFDMGAPYFTARDPVFLEQLQKWRQERVADLWGGRVKVAKHGQVRDTDNLQRYVGTPSMAALCRSLRPGSSATFDLKTEAHVKELRGIPGGEWQVIDLEGTTLGVFQRVVIAVPAEQAVALLPKHSSLLPTLKAVKMNACWCVMVGIDSKDLTKEIPFEGAFIHDSPLSWAANNSSKPGRAEVKNHSCWTLHGSPTWSEEHFNDTPEAVVQTLIAAFCEASGVKFKEGTKPWLAKSHRWRYSSVATPLSDGFLVDNTLQGLYAVGDWANGARVEGAYMSGHLAAQHLLNSTRNHHLASKI